MFCAAECSLNTVRDIWNTTKPGLMGQLESSVNHLSMWNNLPAARGPGGDITGGEQSRTTCQLPQSSAPCRLTQTLTCWWVGLRRRHQSVFNHLSPSCLAHCRKIYSCCHGDGLWCSDPELHCSHLRRSLWVPSYGYQKHLFTPSSWTITLQMWHHQTMQEVASQLYLLL